MKRWEIKYVCRATDGHVVFDESGTSVVCANSLKEAEDTLWFRLASRGKWATRFLRAGKYYRKPKDARLRSI